jgi:RNA-binding protein YhbY
MAQSKKSRSIMHLGKQGLSENFFQTLESHFKTRESVKVVVLKGGGREKIKVKAMAGEILKRLGNQYTAHVIGFTISLRKWRKPVR